MDIPYLLSHTTLTLHRYSGVRRPAAEYPPLQSTQPNRYMPPARRPPSGQPTVPGAPVDPAIISSQMARPDESPKRQEKPQVKEETVAAPVKVSEPAASAVGVEAPADVPPAKGTCLKLYH